MTSNEEESIPQRNMAADEFEIVFQEISLSIKDIVLHRMNACTKGTEHWNIFILYYNFNRMAKMIREYLASRGLLDEQRFEIMETLAQNEVFDLFGELGRKRK